MLLKCEYFKLQTDVLAEDGRRNMKNLKRSSGYFRRRRFSRRSFRIIAFKLWMLTYFIAEENKRQNVLFYLKAYAFCLLLLSCVTSGKDVVGSWNGKRDLRKWDGSVYLFSKVAIQNTTHWEVGSRRSRCWQVWFPSCLSPWLADGHCYPLFSHGLSSVNTHPWCLFLFL